MKRNQIWIVNQGEWGLQAAADGSFNAHIRVIKRALEDRANVGREVGVTVIADYKNIAATSDDLAQSVWVFMTEGMLLDAKEMAQKYSNLRVVLFSGDIQERDQIVAKGVILLGKAFDYRDVPRLVLGED